MATGSPLAAGFTVAGVTGLAARFLSTTLTAMLPRSIFCVIAGFARLLADAFTISAAVFKERSCTSYIAWHARQHALEIVKRLADEQSTFLHLALANRSLVVAAPFLHHRDGLANRTRYLEIAHEDHGVSEVAHLGCYVHRIPEDSVLHQRHDAGDTVVGEKTEQLVDLDREQSLFRHRLHVAVDRIDDDERPFVVFDGVHHLTRKLAGRKFGRLDLGHSQQAGCPRIVHLHSQC